MKVSWEDYKNKSENSSSNPANGWSEPYVGYFSLKEGEEAIVRVMEDDPNNVDILACHWANVEGRDRWVSCPRSPKDPIDNCPLCAADKPIAYRAFIKVIHYVKDEEGNMKSLAKIWDRPASFVSIIQDRIEDYGPLSNIICKIKRHGSGKSTTYDLLPQSSERYPESSYPKKENAFKNFNILGHSVVDMAKKNDTKSVKEDYAPREVVKEPVEKPVSIPKYQEVRESSLPENNSTSQEINSSDTPFARPRRFYK